MFAKAYRVCRSGSFYHHEQKQKSAGRATARELGPALVLRRAGDSMDRCGCLDGHATVKENRSKGPGCCVSSQQLVWLMMPSQNPHISVVIGGLAGSARPWTGFISRKGITQALFLMGRAMLDVSMRAPVCNVSAFPQDRPTAHWGALGMRLSFSHCLLSARNLATRISSSA